jgi:hypothetical protein
MYGNMVASAVNTALSTTQVQSQYQVAAAKKGMDAQKLIGESAVKLIQSASVDPNVGQNLNVMA